MMTHRHTSLSISQFLMVEHILVLSQPAFSPDLSPCDFWLFPKFKGTMKGKLSNITDNITFHKTG
jgi:histone-lysine N-methyltransferase SETMAR